MSTQGLTPAQVLDSYQHAAGVLAKLESGHAPYLSIVAARDQFQAARRELHRLLDDRREATR